MAKTKWMIHPETNIVYPYNEHVVKEFGWRCYDGPLPKIGPNGHRVLNEDSEFENHPQEILEREDKAKKAAEKHIVKIVEALKEMPPLEFVTTNGMPKITSLEKMCGFKPTVEERGAAFQIFKSGQAEDTASA